MAIVRGDNYAVLSLMRLADVYLMYCGGCGYG